MNFPPGTYGTEDYFYDTYVCECCGEVEVKEGDALCESCALHSEEAA